MKLFCRRYLDVGLFTCTLKGIAVKKRRISLCIIIACLLLIVAAEIWMRTDFVEYYISRTYELLWIGHLAQLLNGIEYAAVLILLCTVFSLLPAPWSRWGVLGLGALLSLMVAVIAFFPESGASNILYSIWPIKDMLLGFTGIQLHNLAGLLLALGGFRAYENPGKRILGAGEKA